MEIHQTVSNSPFLYLARIKARLGLYNYDFFHTKQFYFFNLNVNPVTLENNRWLYTPREIGPYSGKTPGLQYFDAQFFKVHERLGEKMDVMSRKLLEQSYQAIYDAGNLLFPLNIRFYKNRDDIQINNSINFDRLL